MVRIEPAVVGVTSLVSMTDRDHRSLVELAKNHCY